MLLHCGERVGGFLRDGGLLGVGQRAPRRSAETQHLVQNAVGLGRERDGRDFGGDLGMRMVSRGHEASLADRCLPIVAIVSGGCARRKRRSRLIAMSRLKSLFSLANFLASLRALCDWRSLDKS